MKTFAHVPFIAAALSASLASLLPTHVIIAGDELLTSANSVQSVRLMAADSDAGYSFIGHPTADSHRTLAPNTFIRWGEPQVSSLLPFLLLTDGSELVLARADDIEHLQRDRLAFRSDTFRAAQISIDSLRAIVFRPPRDIALRDRLTQRLMNNDLQSDELVLITGDVLRGRLDAIDNQSVHFRTEQRQRLVVRESVAMITLDPKFSKRPTLPPHAILGLRDGHRLNAESVSVEDDSAQIELFDGTVLTTAPSVRPIEDGTITFVQPLGQHIQYLSDLQPSSFKHIPYLSGEWQYGMDRDVHGRQLVASLTKRRAVKGIAMHSTSRLTFDLPGGYRTFAAELSLAHSEERQGSVVYRVFLKRSSDWQEAYRSPIVRAMTPHVTCQIPLEINSEPASSISLVVDFADRADQGDHALWLDARLFR